MSGGTIKESFTVGRSVKMDSENRAQARNRNAEKYERRGVMDWIRCTTEQMVEMLRNCNTANLPMEQVADRLEAHQKEHCSRMDEVRKMQADCAALLARAEAAEAELARVKASGIESMRRAEAAEKERDHFAEHSKMVEAESTRMKEALKGLLMVSTSQRTTIEEQADAITIAREALKGGRE